MLEHSSTSKVGSGANRSTRITEAGAELARSEGRGETPTTRKARPAQASGSIHR